MPLKTLVVIALRLYAIYWLVDGLSALLVLLPVYLTIQEQLDRDSHLWGIAPEFLYLMVPPGMFGISAALWFLASWLSSQVTKGHDTQLAITSLTREDLYRFAFVFLGLYFLLTSIFATLQAGHEFFAFDLPLPVGNAPQLFFHTVLHG